MLETCQLPADEALEREAEGMAELFGSPVNAALINVFFLTDRNKNDTGLDRTDVAAQPIKSVGVIGSGIMGSGIAGGDAQRARSRSPLTDANAEALARGAQASAGRSRLQQEDRKAPTSAKTLKLAPLLVGRRIASEEIARVRPGDRGDRRERRRQEAALRRLEPLLRPRRDPRQQHFDDSDHAAGRGAEAARAILRPALLQSRAADAAGRGDSRRKDERRDGRHGRRLCQADRQDRRSSSTTGPAFWSIGCCFRT